MKRFTLCFFLSIGLSAAIAQSDVQEVTDRQAEFNAALVHPDSVVFDKLTADSLSYGHSAWKIQSKQAFIADILHGPASFSNLVVSSQTVSVSGKNAVVREQFEADLTTAGQATKVKLGILLVWQKEKQGWKLLARQAVKLP